MPSTPGRLSDVAELTPVEPMLRKRTRHVGGAQCIKISAAMTIADKVIFNAKNKDRQDAKHKAWQMHADRSTSSVNVHTRARGILDEPLNHMQADQLNITTCVF